MHPQSAARTTSTWAPAWRVQQYWTERDDRRKSTRSNSEPFDATVLHVTPRSTCPSFFHAPRVTRHDDDDRVMQKAIEERNCSCGHGAERGQLLERPMTGHTQAAALVLCLVNIDRCPDGI